MLFLILLSLVLYPLLRILYRKLCTPNYLQRTVWITGASSGIGEHLAYEFNSRGASIIISARNCSELERVKSQCKYPEKVEVVPLDMTNYEEVRLKSQSVIKQLESSGKKLDVLVENAGVSMRCEFRNYSFQNHKNLFEVNVHGPFHHIQSCIEHMVKNKSGQIVGITSIAGKISTAYRSSYSGSKHAFIGILDSLRTQFKPYNIKVCNVMPGYIRTNLSKNAFSAGKGEKFGLTDNNIANGMDPQKFARQAVRGIYCEQNQFQVSKGWLGVTGMTLRNLCPDLVFKLLEHNAKNQSKAISDAGKSE